MKFEFKVKENGCTKESCCPKLILHLMDRGFVLQTEDGYDVINAYDIEENGEFNVCDLQDNFNNEYIAKRLGIYENMVKYRIEKKTKTDINFTWNSRLRSDC